MLEIGYGDLRRNQLEFASVAKEIDPTKKTPQEVLAQLALIHPPPDKLLQTFQDQFSGLIGFINSHHIISIPSDVEPTLEETPPFMRATTQASMDPPGSLRNPLDDGLLQCHAALRKTGRRNISQNTWPRSTSAPSRRPPCTRRIPGHYVQFLYLPQFSSKIRKVLGANTNIEGWAHYCEQMMLDEGYLPKLTGSA